MEWQDEGIILHTQTLGERKQIVSLFTSSHGRCAGVLQTTQKQKGWVHCGGKVKARWGARLENHIGYWTFEALHTPTAFLLDLPGPLAALLSAASLCHIALPERHSYSRLYEKFEELVCDLLLPHWARSYAFFELILLEELGYGLDFQSCAVTGKRPPLAAVSKRTGRAVCEEVAQEYPGRLLPLPAFIYEGNSPISPGKEDIAAALRLSGHFLERHLLGRALPPARTRFLQLFS